MIPFEELRHTARAVAHSTEICWDDFEKPGFQDAYLARVEPILWQLPVLIHQYEYYEHHAARDTETEIDHEGFEAQCEALEDDVFQALVVEALHDRYLAIQGVTR